MTTVLLLLLGCGSDCGDTCPLGTACDAGTCVARACATSDQCPLDHHCTADGACAEGCRAPADCPVGSVCGGDGACVRAACVDTATDCGWREECRAGRCVDAGAAYCAPCARDAECSGRDDICFAGEWCGVACGAGGACPAGFDCTEVAHTDGAVHRVCLAACWLDGVR